MKYYNINNILKCKADYNIIIGQRANGKSYSVKKYILKQCKKHGQKFIFIKRYDNEIKKLAVERYFSDMPIDEFFQGSMYITLKAGVIYAAHKEKNKTVLDEEIGYIMALNQQIKYKSQAYPDVKNIIFEEFNCENYLPDEVENFINLYSTVNRARNNVQVFFIGNTIVKFNPYIFAFNLLEDIQKLKQGEIIFKKEKNFTVAVEWCKKLDITEKTPDDYSTMINDGEYSSHVKILEKEVYKNSKVIFEFFRYCGDFKFIEQILQYRSKIYYFVYPYTGKKRRKIVNDITRIHGGQYSHLNDNQSFKRIMCLRFPENVFFSDPDTFAIYHIYKGGLI